MVEGVDDDDKYRMVEDEFLTIAQRFTVHLHAAEYKRQQKMAKTRNADTINSISRPVTGKMPDQTRRKVEAIAREKTQKTIIEKLAGKKEDSDDDFEVSYVGTSLHGLMDSPSKKKASLKKISAVTTTRAAAGFKQPAQSSARRRSLGSPQPRSAPPPSISEPLNVKAESSSDDDDLDVAPKPLKIERKSVEDNRSNSVSVKKEVKTLDVQLPLSKIPTQIKDPISKHHELKPASKPMIPFTKSTSPPKVRNRPSRIEMIRARRLKEEQEKEQEQMAKKKLDVIPTFL